MLQQELQQATRYFSSQQFNQVITLCQRIVIASPQRAEAHQLLIQSYIRTNQLKYAESAIDTAESAFPAATWLTQLKAMLFQFKGEPESELDQLDLLLSAQPNNAALLNRYIRLAVQLADWESAQKRLHQYQNCTSDKDINLRKLKVHYFRQRGWLDKALDESKQLKAIAPTDISIAHDHAVILRLNGKAKEAITLLQNILANTDHFAVHQNLANAFSDVGLLNEAEKHYRNAIALNPDYIDAYVNLSLILWEKGEKERYLEHFEKPGVLNSPSMQYAYITVLLNAKSYKKVISRLDEAPEFKNQTSGQLLLAKALRGTGEFISSYEIMQELAKKDHSSEVLIELGVSAIEANDCSAAEQATEAVLHHEPDNQLAKAYWHAARKAGGREGYEIKDYVEKFNVFPQMDSVKKAAYLTALIDHLTSLHSAIEQPINQTLENGTQTRGHLFASDNPLIQTLKRAVDKVVLKFIDTQGLDRHRLTDSSGMPHYKGSWSVRLSGSGYHHNHIHSHGRISGVVHLALPQATKDREKQEGWLALGQPYRYQQGNSPADVVVEPSLLHCVLFRSFVWHGTTPFKENTHRITVAFDVGEYGQP